MIRHRLMIVWYDVAWVACRTVLHWWLWGGPWESRQVIDWFLNHIAARHYYHEHALTG